MCAITVLNSSQKLPYSPSFPWDVQDWSNLLISDAGKYRMMLEHVQLR